MSPLPKKKKTPEELAALRESLGISSDGPAPGAPDQAPTAPPDAISPEAVPGKPVSESTALPKAKSKAKRSAAPEEESETIEKTESEAIEKIEVDGSSAKVEPLVLETEEAPVEVKAKPVRSLRKSSRLTVDKPKKVVSKDSGKLPTRRHREGERIPLEKPSEPTSSGNGNLPARKHSDEELARLRRAPLPGVEAPAVHFASKTASPLALFGIYGAGAMLMILAMMGGIAGGMSRFDLPFEWLQDAVVLPHYRMILFGIMSGGVGVMLIGAAWIFFKKPISQYHAAILTIIAVLVLVFGTLYFFPGLHGA